MGDEMAKVLGNSEFKPSVVEIEKEQEIVCSKCLNQLETKEEKNVDKKP